MKTSISPKYSPSSKPVHLSEDMFISQQKNLEIKCKELKKQEEDYRTKRSEYKQKKQILAAHVRKVHELTQNIEMQMESVKQAEVEFKSKEEKVKIREDQIQEILQDIENYCQLAENMRKANTELTEKLERYEQDTETKRKEYKLKISKLREAKSLLNSQQFELSQRKETLLRDLEACSSVIEQITADIDSSDTIARLRAQLIVKEKQLKVEFEESCIKQSKLAERAKKMNEDCLVLAQNRKGIKDITDEVNESHDALEKKKQQIDALQANIQAERDKIRAEYGKFEEEIESLTEEEAKIDQEISIMKSNLEKAYKEKEELIEKEKYLNEHSEVLRERDSNLRTAEEALDTEEEDLKSKLIEAERREYAMKMKHDLQGDLDLKMEGLKLGEDIWERRHSEEVTLLQDWLNRIQKKENELDEREMELQQEEDTDTFK
jgi:hypothetical protein